ncbi:hypothetical protein [Allobranchiibius sp. GilTou38]|nr:hypothetical protein [Allobranchiibius sp. GilTou38]
MFHYRGRGPLSPLQAFGALLSIAVVVGGPIVLAHLHIHTSSW